MTYNFNISIKCNKGGVIEVDTVAAYGYFERLDGSEGGGLWFERCEIGSKMLELVDYDGMAILPMRVITALRENGFYVSDDM